MDRFRVPSTADFHVPKSMLGLTISSTVGKEHFRVIRINIEKYSNNSFHISRLLQIVDDFDETKCLGHARSMQVLDPIVTYLRIKLLLSDIYVVEKVAVLVDTLVKNCQYRVHLLVGSRIFMKTFGVVTRHLLSDERKQHYKVGARMLDILQGWGEAFSHKNRFKIYPHIVETYHKMQSKYGFTYQRAHFDPSRVPIFLGPLHEKEILESRWAGSCMARNGLPFDCCPSLVNSSLYIHGGSHEAYTESPAYTEPLYLADHGVGHSQSGLMSRSDHVPETLHDSNKKGIVDCSRKSTEHPKKLQQESKDGFLLKAPDCSPMQTQITDSTDNEYPSSWIVGIISITDEHENTPNVIHMVDDLEKDTFVVSRRETHSSFNCCDPSSQRGSNDKLGSSTAASSVDETRIEDKEFAGNFQICRKGSGDFSSNLKSSMSSVSDDLVDKMLETILPNRIKCASKGLSLNIENIDNIDSINSIDTLFTLKKTPHTGKKTSEAFKSPTSIEKVSSKYFMPSSDPTLEIKYFGHQRVLVKKVRL
jgi:VHS domain